MKTTAAPKMTKNNQLRNVANRIVNYAKDIGLKQSYVEIGMNENGQVTMHVEAMGKDFKKHHHLRSFFQLESFDEAAIEAHGRLQFECLLCKFSAIH